MQMRWKDEQRQTVLTRFAAIMTGLHPANDQNRAAILRDAIRHSLTNTEYIRERLRLRVPGGDVTATATRDFVKGNAIAEENLPHDNSNVERDQREHIVRGAYIA